MVYVVDISDDLIPLLKERIKPQITQINWNAQRPSIQIGTNYCTAESTHYI